MSIFNISRSFMLLILISVNYCLANNNYLSDTLPTIVYGLKSNKDQLITQQRIIYISKQALDELVNKKEITKDQADQAKKELETIFETNFKQSSNYQRAMYTMKRPFQFVYQKITNPNASYLERFAYGAAAAVGVAITSYTAYHGGKYIYSALQDWQKETTQKIAPNIPTSTEDKQQQEIRDLIKNNYMYEEPRSLKHTRFDVEETSVHENKRSKEEWKALGNLYRTGDSVLNNIVKRHKNSTKAAQEANLILNPSESILTDPKTGMIYNYRTGNIVDKQGHLLTPLDWKVILSRGYY